MDQAIQRPKSNVKIIGITFLTVSMIGLLFWFLWNNDSAAMVVQSDRLTVSSVVRSPFYEYINLTGNIEPTRTFYIDSRISGNIERVLVESGQLVSVGDTLLTLENADIELEVMQREAQLIEQLNTQRQTALLLKQNYFNQQSQLVEVEYEIGLLKKQYDRTQQLLRESIIATSDFEPVADRYQFLQRRQRLLRQSFQVDSLAKVTQLNQIQASEQRVLENLKAVRKILNRLHVIAAVSGRLSNFSAQVGQAFSSGDRLGEIYSMENAAIVADVDEYYLDKLTIGQKGVVLMSSDTFELRVEKIFPNIEAGRFRVEMGFANPNNQPSKLVKGQSFRIRMFFGEEAETTLLANGNFYNSTGGNWVYIINGDQADRQYIKLGRKNPRFYEVLEGLSPGDQVITSSYDQFETYETLKFN